MNNIKDAIELSSLVGEHLLSGCDCTTEQVLDYGETHVSAGVMRFVLDGKVYEAIEDPEDGYRSSLEGLQLAEGKTVENMFPAIKVMGVHRTERKHDYGTENDDVLELRDENGKTILEVGTSDIDDYYPGCVMNFDYTPE